MCLIVQEPPSGTGEHLYADVDEAMMAAGLLEPMQVQLGCAIRATASCCGLMAC